MTDWAAALAQAFRQHLASSGSTGSGGSQGKKHRATKAFEAAGCGTTGVEAVVPVVPNECFLDGQGPGTTGTTRDQPMVPGAGEHKALQMQAKVGLGTTGTSGTTENGHERAARREVYEERAGIVEHEAGIVTPLRLADNEWSGEDWQAFFAERAGIAEFDGGLPRPEAEARAFACCMMEWLNRHPVRSAPGRCFGCGGGDHADDRLLPFGTEMSGHVWLHSACWPAWHSARQSDAITALVAMGIRR